MFSGNFAKGFITGLADSVNREIQADMAMLEKVEFYFEQLKVR